MKYSHYHSFSHNIFLLLPLLEPKFPKSHFKIYPLSINPIGAKFSHALMHPSQEFQDYTAKSEYAEKVVLQHSIDPNLSQDCYVTNKHRRWENCLICNTYVHRRVHSSSTSRLLDRTARVWMSLSLPGSGIQGRKCIWQMPGTPRLHHHVARALDQSAPDRSTLERNAVFHGIYFNNKRPLGMTAPLSNNTLSMIHMNTQWPWVNLSMPPKVKYHRVSWKTIYDLLYMYIMQHLIRCSI